MVVLPFQVIAMEENDLEKKENEKKEACAWLEKKLEESNFYKDLNEEIFNDITESFWQKFNGQWQYFWQSDDDMNKKGEKIIIFYEDIKKFLQETKNINSLELLGWQLISLGIIQTRIVDNLRLKNLKPFMKFHDDLSEVITNEIPERILDLDSEELEDRIEILLDISIDYICKDIDKIRNI